MRMHREGAKEMGAYCEEIKTVTPRHEGIKTLVSLRGEVRSALDEAVSMRRFLHRHPELSGGEDNTRAYICENLDRWGISYRICPTNKAIYADVGAGEPCIALRADIDALPIAERTGLSYASENPGVMHACGHDIHTAILLAVGKLLKKRETTLNGTVRLLFQPAEETTGGAADMIADGCMENPKVTAVLGLHVAPTLAVGKAEFCPGTMNAAVTDLKLNVQGKGCHGAHPEQGVDAIVAAAQIVTALQSIVSRSIAPTTPGVVTIGTIHGGTKENIVADQVEMTGTIRALEPETQNRLKSAVKRIAENTASAYGASVRVDMNDVCPALINDEQLLNKMIARAEELIGQENVERMSAPSLGADDFAYFSNTAPGCFFNIGTLAEGQTDQALHSPVYAPDEGCIEVGMLLMLGGALAYLA